MAGVPATPLLNQTAIGDGTHEPVPPRLSVSVYVCDIIKASTMICDNLPFLSVHRQVYPISGGEGKVAGGDEKNRKQRIR